MPNTLHRQTPQLRTFITSNKKKPWDPPLQVVKDETAKQPQLWIYEDQDKKAPPLKYSISLIPVESILSILVNHGFTDPSGKYHKNQQYEKGDEQKRLNRENVEKVRRRAEKMEEIEKDRGGDKGEL